MGKQALDAPYGRFFIIDPEDVVVVDDKKHPLYDARIEKPLTESFVRSIEKWGVKRIVIVRKNGKDGAGDDILEVVDGRRRVRGARVANERIKANGGEPIKIKAVLEKGSDDDMTVEMVISNENREEDDLVTKAEKAKRLIDKHGEETAALAFGVEVQTMNGWLLLLDLADDVKAKIKSGEIAASAAKQLVDMPRDEQIKLVSALEESGKKPTANNLAKTTSPKRARLVKARKSLLDIVLSWAKEEAKLDDLKKAAQEYADAKKSAVRGKAKFAPIKVK